MAETHNLHLLASEESDIRHAANAGAEAEIRDLKNRMRPWMLGESYDLRAENDRLRESLHAIAAADWKTSGELRRMARVALEPNNKVRDARAESGASPSVEASPE